MVEVHSLEGLHNKVDHMSVLSSAREIGVRLLQRVSGYENRD